MQVTADEHSMSVAKKHLCVLIIHIYNSSPQRTCCPCSDMNLSIYWTRQRNHCCLSSVALGWHHWLHLFCAGLNEVKLSKPSLISLISLKQEEFTKQRISTITSFLCILVDNVFNKSVHISLFWARKSWKNSNTKSKPTKDGSLGEIQQNCLSSKGSG